MKNRPAMIEAVLRCRGVYLHPTDRIDFLHTNDTGHRMPAVGMVLVHDTLLHMVIYIMGAVRSASETTQTAEPPRPRDLSALKTKFKPMMPKVSLWGRHSLYRTTPGHAGQN
jgi:hypothetical protein